MPKNANIPALISDLRTARGLIGPRWSRRAGAARQLGELRAPQAVSHLIATVESSANDDVKRACADALGRIGGEEATGALARWLVDPAREDVRLVCLLALTRIGDTPARAALMQVNASSSGLTESIDRLQVELERANGDEGRRDLISQALTILISPEASGNNCADPCHEGDEQPPHEDLDREPPQSTTETAATGSDLRLTHVDLAGLAHPDGRARRRAASSLLQADAPELEALRPMLALWGGAPEAPRAVTFEPGADSSASSLVEAIACAGAGGIVWLGPGEYRLSETLTVEQPLALLGAGMDLTRVIGEGSGPVLCVRGADFTAADITFAYEGPGPAAAAEIETGRLHLERCRFTGGSAGEVAPEEPSTMLRLPWDTQANSGASTEAAESVTASTVREEQPKPSSDGSGEGGREGNPHCGLRVAGAARGRLRDCCFAGNAGAGLDMAGEVDLVVEECSSTENSTGIIYGGTAGGTARSVRCAANRVHGVLMTGRARPRLLTIHCACNAGAGMAVLESACPEIHESVCRENAVGIWMGGTAGGTARANQVSANPQAGLWASGQAAPAFEENSFEGNGIGMRYSGSAAGTARGNRVTGSPSGGIELSGSASPALVENTLRENAGGGIVYRETASGICRGNTCTCSGRHGIETADKASPMIEENLVEASSEAGIRVSGKCAPRLQANTCRANAMGIRYTDTAGGAARGNHCTGNRGHGIQVEARARPIVDTNSCEANAGAGIAYFGRAAGTVSANHCLSNATAGISVSEESTPTLHGNICRENRTGILYTDSAGGTARSNRIGANTMYGIQADGTARPVLRSNTCEGNGRAGIAYFDAAAGIAGRNQCQDNAGAGIVVSGDAAPALEGNVCSGNEDGLTFADLAAGTARRNDCSRNLRAGILVQDGASPTLDSNTCDSNGRSGIVYLDTAGGLARYNTCSENAEHGLAAAAATNPTLINNYCRDNKISDHFRARG
jgi:parallel beta-helix repeat protein